MNNDGMFDLRLGIAAALQGTELSPDTGSGAASAFVTNATGQSTAALTPRQQEIRGLLRQGLSNKTIAGMLGISEGTVKNHITEIFKVLNTTNRTQAARPDSAPEKAPMFDADEYLHLALHASSMGNPHACMIYLKEALQLQPGNATAIYLLAVQHAELGLAARAIAGMKTALALEPRLEIARFQLGLLLLDANSIAEAKTQFAALDRSADAALRLYAEAMSELGDGQWRTAREKLELGLAQPSSNPALSALMRRWLEKLAQGQPGKAAAADAAGRAPAETAALQNSDALPREDSLAFLGAYRHSGS